jgi:hypothetical protein
MANFGSVYFVDHKNQTNSYNLLQITRVYALEFFVSFKLIFVVVAYIIDMLALLQF